MNETPKLCPKCGQAAVKVDWQGENAPLTYGCLGCGWREGDAEADRWLKDPALLGYLEDAICAPGSDKPLVGESDNAIQLLLTLVGKGSVEVRGLTGAGKNTLADHVLAIFPRESWVKVGGLTDKSLRYLKDNVKILYVTERRGIKSGQPGEESTAEYDVKVGISEGEISVAVTEKNPETNEFETRFRKVLIESFVFTTTEVDAPPELENRLTILNVRDDIDQNRLVRDIQLTGAQRFAWQKTDYAAKQAAAARVLTEVLDAPTDIIIPYADILKPILSVESSVVRRNTPKILDLVKACARLYHKQRCIVEGPNGARGIVATPEDLALVLYTGERSLSAVLSAIPEKVALVLEVCKRLNQALGAIPITTENITLNLTPAEKTRLGSTRTIQRGVRALAERGVLVPTDNKEGRHRVYSLENGTNPLVIDIPALLRSAWNAYALYTPSLSLVAEQTEPEIGDRERQAAKITDSRPLSPISSPDSSATSDSQDRGDHP